MIGLFEELRYLFIISDRRGWSINIIIDSSILIAVNNQMIIVVGSAKRIIARSAEMDNVFIFGSLSLGSKVQLGACNECS